MTFEEEARDFWAGAGIDPVRITGRFGEVLTLRGTVGDRVVFLGGDGVVDAFGTERFLARWVAEHGAAGHDLVAAAGWPAVLERALAGELAVVLRTAPGLQGPEEIHDHVLIGLADDIGAGSLRVSPRQLAGAAALVRDLGRWSGDDALVAAFEPSHPLGRLVAFLTGADPDAPVPEPPFDVEAAEMRALEARLEGHLRIHTGRAAP